MSLIFRIFHAGIALAQSHSFVANLAFDKLVCSAALGFFLSLSSDLVPSAAQPDVTRACSAGSPSEPPVGLPMLRGFDVQYHFGETLGYAYFRPTSIQRHPALPVDGNLSNLSPADTKHYLVIPIQSVREPGFYGHDHVSSMH
jgi:hypothetical protein